MSGEGGQGKRRRRLVNEGRIRRFGERLAAWSFDEVRALGAEENVAVFRNSFRDLYDEVFPWVEEKKKRRDVGKPWLDDGEFKELVEEKASLYTRKIKGLLSEEEGRRLAEVNREVNRLRRKLKRGYFDHRMSEISGDLRATW